MGFNLGFKGLKALACNIRVRWQTMSSTITLIR